MTSAGTKDTTSVVANDTTSTGTISRDTTSTGTTLTDGSGSGWDSASGLTTRITRHTRQFRATGTTARAPGLTTRA
jgi:hypothetical protein